MPLSADLLKKIKAALGTEHKALVEELDTAHDTDVSESDATKAELAQQKKAASDADKARKKAEVDASKARDDLDAKTKGEGEELAKLRTERDDWKAKAESADTRVAEVKRDALLREAAREAGMRDLDALKMLDIDGVSLDDAGKLVGADAVFKAAKKAKPYLFDSAGGGQPPGQPPRPADPGGGQPGGGNDDDAIAKAIKAAHGAVAPPANGGWGNRVGGSDGGVLQPPKNAA